jgi:hypothetical protein
LYGLGWFLEEYSGRKFVGHTGGVNGFVTSVAMIPEEKLGIIVLTNTDANNFFEALRYEIQDAYLGLPYRNYSKVYLDGSRDDDAERDKLLKLKRDTIAMKPALALPKSAFIGEYVHNVYGKMTIKEESGKLVARFEHHSGRYVTLEPLRKDRFFATWSEALYGMKEWPFVVQAGKVKSITVRMADFVEFTPYEFYKK